MDKQEKLEYIKNNYGYLRVSEISKNINMGSSLISYYAKTLNVNDNKNKYYVKGNIAYFICVHVDSSRTEFTIDESDIELILNFGKWCIKDEKGKKYVFCNKIIKNKKTTIKLHRVILNQVDSNIKIDHIDGNGLNNTRSNIRTGTQSDNMSNLHSARVDNKSTGILNISVDKRNGKFRPIVEIKKKRIYFKDYSNLEEAKILIKYVRAKYLPYSQEYIIRNDIINKTPNYIIEYADKKVLSKIGGI